jgi:hypothetical protein
MLLVLQLQGLVINCHKHQLHHSQAAAARALLGQLLSVGTMDMYAKSGLLRVYNLLI